MIPRISTTSPTDMLTSAFYNEAIYCGKTGFYKGNDNYQCTNMAISRTCEIAGKPVTWYKGISEASSIDKPMFNRSGYGHAKNWIDDTLWETGSSARIGAVMVYGSSYGNGKGHVRVVEKIDGNRLFISGGNESGKCAFKWIDAPKVTATGFLGYIYNPHVKEEDMLIKFEREEGYEYRWSVDGNAYGQPYDVTNEKYFSDSKLEAEGFELMLKVNGSLFYEYDGDHFACGIEKSRGLNNQELEMSCVTDYNDCMSIASVGQELYFGQQKWIIDNKLNESYGAITGLGLILNGKKRNDLHKGFESQWNCKSGRTIIGEDKDGNFLSLSIEAETGSNKGFTCEELQDKCLELGFFNCVCLDGGGSVFRQYRNDQHQLVYDISTNRKVKNALMLYRKRVSQPCEEQIETLKEEYNLLNDKYVKKCEEFDKLKESIKNISVEINKIVE